jgi:hypothetical protein
MAFNDNSGKSAIDQLAASSFLAVAARSLTIIVSLVAIPYIGWTVNSIYEASRRIAIVEGQVGDLRVATGQAYSAANANRDLAITKERLDGINQRVDRLEIRIDGLQGDLNSIQRASAPIERKK